jgi:hypothetical protein
LLPACGTITGTIVLITAIKPVATASTISICGGRPISNGISMMLSHLLCSVVIGSSTRLSLTRRHLGEKISPDSSR